LRPRVSRFASSLINSVMTVAIPAVYPTLAIMDRGSSVGRLQTGDQLNRYFNYIERRYAKVPNRFYFYLTPDGLAPEAEEDTRNWLPISYSAVTRAISQFLENPLLHARVRSFLEQYLEHIEKNVLRNAGSIEKQRSVLKRHAKTFHSLTYLLDEAYIQDQCSEVQFELLKSIIAIHREVGRELFEFTKQMMAKYHYSRYSGLSYWITIVPPKLRLIQSGLASVDGALPIVFAFDSRPDSYAVEIWLYKKSALFLKNRGRLSQFLVKDLGRNREDGHLVAVLFREVIINTDEIIRGSLAELKNRIAAYFASDLKKHLDESATKVGNMLDSIAPHETR